MGSLNQKCSPPSIFDAMSYCLHRTRLTSDFLLLPFSEFFFTWLLPATNHAANFLPPIHPPLPTQNQVTIATSRTEVPIYTPVLPPKKKKEKKRKDAVVASYFLPWVDVSSGFLFSLLLVKEMASSRKSYADILKSARQPRERLRLVQQKPSSSTSTTDATITAIAAAKKEEVLPGPKPIVPSKWTGRRSWVSVLKGVKGELITYPSILLQ